MVTRASIKQIRDANIRSFLADKELRKHQDESTYDDIKRLARAIINASLIRGGARMAASKVEREFRTEHGLFLDDVVRDDTGPNPRTQDERQLLIERKSCRASATTKAIMDRHRIIYSIKLRWKRNGWG
ncbi:hypothetical protein MPSEU_000938700 [Mayamaea pseudoterrestris]|nr:hypothetical protein MPSEU_000938700 [Mayamaea pseudoterrestris]